MTEKERTIVASGYGDFPEIVKVRPIYDSEEELAGTCWLCGEEPSVLILKDINDGCLDEGLGLKCLKLVIEKVTTI